MHLGPRKGKTVIDLDEEVGQQEFSLLLDFVYCQPLTVTLENAFQLLVLAIKYVGAT
jgi:hypothetical protein